MFALLFLLLVSFTSNVAPAYPNRLTLTPCLNVSWTQDNSYITFQLDYCRAASWVLFGFGSDVVVTYLKRDNTGHFSNRKLENMDIMTFTANQNYWKLLNTVIQMQTSSLTFTRPVRICDTINGNVDIMPGIGTNTIVYALRSSNAPQIALNDFEDLSSSISLRSIGVTLQKFIDNANTNILSQSNGPFDCVIENVTQNNVAFMPTASYTNFVDLISGVYRLYWNSTQTDIIGEIHCLTNGWVGFGLSPNGGMEGSDVIVGWISDGITNFTHRHVRGDMTVVTDSSPLWKLLYAGQMQGFTIFKFTRPIVSCDPFVRTITTGTSNVIFAYGDLPINGSDIAYHGQGQRGTLEVNLINGPSTKSISFDNQEIVDFTISNTILPYDSTTYYCKTFQIPPSLRAIKRHIFKWEVMLSNLNIQKIHNVLIYECPDKFYNGTPAIPIGQCLTQYCQTIGKAWAIGAELVTFYPPDTGYPIGGDADYSYIMIQVHYNNPDLSLGFIQYLNVRFYMTQTLQPNELAMLTLGADMSIGMPFSITLPPNIPKIGISTYCTSDCIQKYLTNTNITVVLAGPRTHLAGREIWTKIIRNGTDIGYLFNNQNYNFNYQHNYLLNPYAVITKDDVLKTYCAYNTIGRSGLTKGGEAKTDETCFQFLTYYPRSANINYCASAPYYMDFLNLLNNLRLSGDIKTYYDVSSLDDIKATIWDFYTSQDSFSNNLRNSFINFYDTTRIVTSCNYEQDFFNGQQNQPVAQMTLNTDNFCASLANQKLNSNRLIIILLSSLLAYCLIF